MRIVLATVVAMLALPAVAQAGGETSIFYYPWWGTPKRDGSFLHWNQRGHAPPVDLATTYYPARGVYSSSDWQLLRSQMKEIASTGVREVVSSWWGRGSIEDRRLPAVMRAAWRDRLDVAVQLEPYDKTRRTAEVVAGDLAYLRGIGIHRVYVYMPFDGVIDDEAWQELNATYAGLEIWAHAANVERVAAAGFDGVYTYDVYGIRGGAFAGLCERARAAGLACSPSVGPGYNAHRATDDERIRWRRDGKTYDGMWQAAIAAKPDRITITSYNEWHEGTQIEPARKVPKTLLATYATYEGAYGKTGRTAETAYLARTAYWTKTYRVAAAVTHGLRALASVDFVNP